MVVQLYGFHLSTCSRRVVTYLYEKKIPFEFHSVDMFIGAHKDKEFVKTKHPFGMVPVLNDDGFVVYESRAIIRYLESKYPELGPELVPSRDDIKKTAIFEQAASVELATFDPLASKLHFETIIKPLIKQETNKELVAETLALLEVRLDGYESILSKQKYLAGDEFTLVDLFHLPYAEGLGEAGYDLLKDEAKRPNLARWWKDVSSREAWTKAKSGEMKTTLSY